MAGHDDAGLRRLIAQLTSADDDIGIDAAGVDATELFSSAETIRTEWNEEELAALVVGVVRVSRPDQGVEIGNWLVRELLIDTSGIPLDVVRVAESSEGFPEPQVGWLLSRADPETVDEGLIGAIEATVDPAARSRFSRLLRLSRHYVGASTGPAFGGGVAPVLRERAPMGDADDRTDEPVRVVSTGFCDAYVDDEPLGADETLKVIEPYCIWVEIGEPQAGAVDETHDELADVVPARADLDVVLFPRSGDVAFESPTTAVIALRGDEPPEVIEPAYSHEAGRASRAYFLVRPRSDGEHTVRCNIYYRHALIQSRIIRFLATQMPEPHPGALAARLDFTLQTSFDQRWFDDREPYLLSLLVNQNPDRSHQFMFHGAADGRRHVSAAALTEGEISTIVGELRKGLRLASYGSEEDYSDRFRNDFRHRTPDRGELTDDLVRLAVRGHRVYLSIADRLAPSTVDLDRRQARRALEALMRRPGFVQIATKVSPTLLMPAGLLYDHPLDTDVPGHALCSAFLDALDAGADLAATACFLGDCPSYDDPMLVCPSGFWAYRHALGLPSSDAPTVDVVTGEEQPVRSDTASHIPYADQPRMVIGHATSLLAFDQHLAALQAISGFEIGGVLAEREQLFPALEGAHPQIVYLYCHGGLSRQIPYLEIGAEGSVPITPQTVQTRCYWPDDRPLVFLNGCRTTALSPESAHEFVTAFTGEPRASGVVGTEVTIVEDLARPFAEYFFAEFEARPDGRSETVGEAIRRARLKLLGDGNPLGLVYSPFVMPDVRLVRSN